jgi:hypothetical protein
MNYSLFSIWKLIPFGHFPPSISIFDDYATVVAFYLGQEVFTQWAIGLKIAINTKIE